MENKSVLFVMPEDNADLTNTRKPAGKIKRNRTMFDQTFTLHPFIDQRKKSTLFSTVFSKIEFISNTSPFIMDNANRSHILFRLQYQTTF